ncbi:MAG: alanine--glyoxylate aminotransferase family protein [Anaerolineae bacterium]|nr:alanine--glyoxylate aminotransferase family protein [Anaerolineae bacterium]
METYPIPMVPGPVVVPQRILDVYRNNFGSGDLETEFLELYNRTEANLQQMMQTRNKVVIHTGEGMIALWGALKSCLLPGDRVLAIATGVFGYGIGEMAEAIGAVVRTIAIPYDQTVSDWDEIEQVILDYKPKMITVVHCETPSGTLNPIAQIGALKVKHRVPLLYVDAVASLGGAPVKTDEWNIDLCLGGSQKVLSVPPSMAFLSVSDQAWEIIHQVNYPGYDALKPFATAQKDFYFPYTPYWHGVAALNIGVEMLLEEGLENSFARHQKVAAFCRQELERMGLELFPAAGAVPSPTVTAVKVPISVGWRELNARFRRHGLAVGGSYGPLAEKVFRLGHMGSQASMELVERALEAIRKSL